MSNEKIPMVLESFYRVQLYVFSRKGAHPKNIMNLVLLIIFLPNLS